MDAKIWKKAKLPLFFIQYVILKRTLAAAFTWLKFQPKLRIMFVQPSLPYSSPFFQRIVFICTFACVWKMIVFWNYLNGIGKNLGTEQEIKSKTSPHNHNNFHDICVLKKIEYPSLFLYERIYCNSLKTFWTALQEHNGPLQVQNIPDYSFVLLK